MTTVANPAWERFVAHLGREGLVAQVLVRRLASGFELRHEADRAAADASLQPVTLSELRPLAQTSAGGSFRPLKSAPNLRSGWRAVFLSGESLCQAIDHLYPGAIADWFATQGAAPPVTHYREFTERQTGMYRITTMLSDDQAGQVIAACCAARFCLKCRLWTVAGLEPDQPTTKSVIPCLEPCAILLEFARKAMRLEQEDKATLTLPAGDLETLAAALEAALDSPNAREREADFGAPGNPRRLRLTLEKLKARLSELKQAES